MYTSFFSALDYPIIDVSIVHDFWNAKGSPSCWVLWENVSYMRRSLTGVNNRWHFRKAGFEISIDTRVIEGAENDGVHEISWNSLFLELQGITGFWVNFQTSDLNIDTALNRRVSASWTRILLGPIPKNKSNKGKERKTSKNGKILSFLAVL